MNINFKLIPLNDFYATKQLILVGNDVFATAKLCFKKRV